MWPWEHAIVGYLAYSLFCHLYYRDPPGGLEAFAVVLASVLPDVIDKPLAWEFGAFETGYALGHSVFFAVPLALVVGVLARTRGGSRTGLAFGAGYLLHLPGDVFYPSLRGGDPQYEIVRWPIVTVASSASGRPGGFLERFADLFGRYRAEMLAEDPSTYVLVQIAVVGVAFLVWLYDGAPVARELLAGSRRLVLGRT